MVWVANTIQQKRSSVFENSICSLIYGFNHRFQISSDTVFSILSPILTLVSHGQMTRLLPNENYITIAGITLIILQYSIYIYIILHVYLERSHAYICCYCDYQIRGARIDKICHTKILLWWCIYDLLWIVSAIIVVITYGTTAAVFEPRRLVNNNDAWNVLEFVCYWHCRTACKLIVEIRGRMNSKSREPINGGTWISSTCLGNSFTFIVVDRAE